MVSLDAVRLKSCLHRRRAGDRPGSSKRRDYAASYPSSANVPPYRWLCSRDRCFPPDQSSPCSPAKLYGSRPTAISPTHTRLLWQPAAPNRLLTAPSARLFLVATPDYESSCPAEYSSAATHCPPECRHPTR